MNFSAHRGSEIAPTGAKPIWQRYFTAPLLTILALGFTSGLPLALTASTLSAWLFDAHVDKGSIGLFAAVATPYTLKFLWSPVMDSVPLPWLTRAFGLRRGWILATQLALIAALILLSLARPGINAFATAMAALLVAFLSASQDIVIDAYRVEILVPDAQGQGAAMAQFGYRVGMLAGGAGGLKLAHYLGWQTTYCIMAALMGVGIAAALLAREPLIPRPSLLAPRAFADWLRESVAAPFLDFMRHRSWLLILAFIVVYKLADAFIGIMTTPFLLEIGFSKDRVADIVKIYGLIATLLGMMAGGTLTARYGAMRMMFIAGFLHALTNLLYVLQAHVGADGAVLAACTFAENFTGGISNVAFVAYLSGLCNVHYTATQYALLSSLAAFGRAWLAAPAGYVAKYLGWEWFFALSALLAAPGLIALWVLRGRLNSASAQPHRPAASR